MLVPKVHRAFVEEEDGNDEDEEHSARLEDEDVLVVLEGCEDPGKG